MKVGILSIGDEVLFGEIVDTNAPWIAAKLHGEGLTVIRHACVGDRERDIVEALKGLSEKCGALIVTGGLGPTSDDVTSHAAATAAGTTLALHDDALAHLKEMAETRGATFFPLNQKQALLPAGCGVIPNPIGTACGFTLSLGKCRCFFLPGVPAEMKRMFEETLLPLLKGESGGRVAITRTFRVFGLSEAALEPLLKEVEQPERGIGIAYCVDFPQIEVKLRGSGEDRALLQERMQEAERKVREILREWIVAEEGETIDTVVARLLRERGKTLSLAESCTGGMIASRITDLPGSSAYFLEGAVTYSNAAKVRLLGVPEETIREHGAVSTETAIAMATGMRRAAGSDLSLAVTGVAGPGESEAKPAGTVHIALADANGCDSRLYRFHGDRGQVRLLTVVTALDLLRRHLLKSSP